MNCDKVTKINIPEATNIKESAFEGCYAVTEINAPKVQNLETRALGAHWKLKTVRLPELVYIGREALGNCYALEEIYAPKCVGVTSNFTADKKLKKLVVNDKAMFTCLNEIPKTCVIYNSNETKILNRQTEQWEEVAV